LYGLIEFTTEQEHVNAFLAVAAHVYKGDKNYSPERASDTIAWLAGKHNFTGLLEQKNLLVLRDNAPAARGIAFVNKIGGFGSIGFFECMDDKQAVKLLADSAAAFCRQHGISNIYAPMNGSIWSDYRLMTRGFEDRPFLGEPYNKPYYSSLLTECGFKPVKTWETQFVSKVEPRSKTAQRYLHEEKAQQSRGIKIRSMKNFDTDIRIIHRLAMNAFSQFFLFHELDESDFVNAYAGLKRICDKRTIKIAYSHDNQPIGFGIALPDYRSRLGFFLRYAKRYSLLYIGTLQENGESVYPQCGKAIIVSILRSLFLRRKGYIRAMMSVDSKTRHFSKEYENIHEYTLFGLEVDL